MAAGPWVVYATAKKYLASGGIDVDSDSFLVGLFTSASNAANVALSVLASVTGAITSQPLTGVIWQQGTSARQMRFTASPMLFSGPLSNIKYAVISDAASSKLLCYSMLSAAQFSLSGLETHTVQPSANGIFKLA
jgi:hypothetical protein